MKREGDGLAEVAFGVGIAAEGDEVEAGGAVDAGGWCAGEGEGEGVAGGFVLAEGLAVAAEEVTAIDGRLFELTGAEEGGFGVGEAVGGDVGETEAAPLGGVVRRGEEEEEKSPRHGTHSTGCGHDILPGDEVLFFSLPLCFGL